MKYVVCAFVLVSMSSVYADVQEKLKPAHKNFLAADADKSGGLDLKEFKVFIDANAAINFGRAKEIKKRNAYDRVFSKVDKDNSGSMTWGEFESMQ
jgi:Ca2+-binding EF-hand superfamily protein